MKRKRKNPEKVNRLMVTDGEELLSTVILCDPDGNLTYAGKHVRRDSPSIPTLAVVGAETPPPKRPRPRKKP